MIKGTKKSRSKFKSKRKRVTKKKKNIKKSKKPTKIGVILRVTSRERIE